METEQAMQGEEARGRAFWLAAAVVAGLAFVALAFLAAPAGSDAHDHATSSLMSAEFGECHLGCEGGHEPGERLIDIQHGGHCDLVPVSCFGQSVSTGSPLAADLGSLVVTAAGLLHQSDPPSETTSSDAIVGPQSPPPRTA